MTTRFLLSAKAEDPSFISLRESPSSGRVRAKALMVIN